MICHHKPSIITKTITKNYAPTPKQRNHLVARWQEIEGKLVCKWVSS